jgi:hypothetical protein
MKNIKFNYLYRDAGNYKVYGEVVFANPNNISLDFLESELRKNLIDSEFFDPLRLKIPALKHLNHSYDHDLDHSWNEFVDFEPTQEVITDSRPIETFLKEATTKVSL